MIINMKEQEKIRIFNRLKILLGSYSPPLTIKQNTDRAYDLWSMKDIVIEGKKRKEVFFASVIIQKGYVGFYFMPVYAQSDLLQVFKPELLSLKKGLSCFHIKNLDEIIENQISDALKIGFSLYVDRGWIETN